MIRNVSATTNQGDNMSRTYVGKTRWQAKQDRREEKRWRTVRQQRSRANGR